MSWLKWIGGAVLLIVVVVLVAGFWLLNDRASMEPYENLRMAVKPPAAGGVRVKFFGVATVLIEDGETALLTDGFFSRPGISRLLLGKVEPDVGAIERGLKRAGIAKLSAVIVNHSHYDHAMDSPEVARRTGAMLVGSESTANIGRGWGLAETQIQVPQTGEALRFGRFTVTLLPSRHAPTGFTGGDIASPLKPPAAANDYLEGASYAVLVQHEGRSLLINASAGFEPGALKNVHADVVMLGTGALGTFKADYREDYWREVVATVGAQRVIPIHWDDFTVPSDGPFLPQPNIFGRFDHVMDFLKGRGAKDGVEIRLPREWQPMDVWDGLN